MISPPETCLYLSRLRLKTNMETNAWYLRSTWRKSMRIKLGRNSASGKVSARKRKECRQWQTFPICRRFRWSLARTTWCHSLCSRWRRWLRTSAAAFARAASWRNLPVASPPSAPAAGPLRLPQLSLPLQRIHQPTQRHSI